jgi:hypothetical protein
MKMQINPAVLLAALQSSLASIRESDQQFQNVKTISTARINFGSSPNHENRKAIRKRRNKAAHKLGRRNRRH